MANFINMLKDALKVCNADKAALRTWAGDPTRAEVVQEAVPEAVGPTD